METDLWIVLVVGWVVIVLVPLLIMRWRRKR